MGVDENGKFGTVRCIDCDKNDSDTSWEKLDENDDREVFKITCEHCGNTADLINKKGFNPDMALSGRVEPVSGLVAKQAEVSR